MADEQPVDEMDARGALRECGLCGKNIRVDDRGNFKSHAGQYGGPCTGSGKYAGMSAMDLNSVEVGADGSIRVETDPSGDEAGKMSVCMDRSAACPYCERPTMLSGGVLGAHRVTGGACDGSGRRVEKVVKGRAVLMAKPPTDKLGQLLNRGDRVAVAGMTGKVVFIKRDEYNLGNVIVQVDDGDTYTVGRSLVTRS